MGFDSISNNHNLEKKYSLKIMTKKTRKYGRQVQKENLGKINLNERKLENVSLTFFLKYKIVMKIKRPSIDWVNWSECVHSAHRLRFSEYFGLMAEQFWYMYVCVCVEWSRFCDTFYLIPLFYHQRDPFGVVSGSKNQLHLAPITHMRRNTLLKNLS